MPPGPPGAGRRQLQGPEDLGNPGVALLLQCQAASGIYAAHGPFNVGQGGLEGWQNKTGEDSSIPPSHMSPQ